MRVSCDLLFSILFLGAYALAAADQKPPKDFDHNFLSKVPDHHQGAVQMATLCEQKAHHPELKTFCSTLATEQGQERSQMESWLSSWYGDQRAAVPEIPRMQAKQKGMIAKLQSANGEQFAHVFLMNMTEHHEDGMPDMKACVASAKHSDLQQLSRQMSQEQQNEVGQMRTWMKEWGAMGTGAKKK